MHALKAYLSGEIHTDWREQIEQGVQRAGVNLTILAPITDHAASDDCGDVLGTEDKPFWKDHKSSKINAIRTRTLMQKADIVIVRFAEKYKQWNAAFDAGYAAALNKPLIVIHHPDLTHALKEVDAAALAVAETPEQVVEILKYVMQDV